MRRLIAASAGLLTILGTVGALAPSAQAAETVTKPFELTYGASYWKGDVYFSTGRSATASGVLRSVAGSGCRYAEVKAWSGNVEYQTKISQRLCNGETATIDLTASADVPGGVTMLVVGLWTAPARTGGGDVLVRSNRIYR